jgi:hypothetical protein
MINPAASMTVIRIVRARMELDRCKAAVLLWTIAGRIVDLWAI